MSNTMIRPLSVFAVFALLAGAVLAFAPAARAQYYSSYPGPTGQLVITTQTAAGLTTPVSAATVTVTGSGPSLTSTPSSSGSLNYSTNFGNDTRVVTMIPGNYNVSAADGPGYSYTYSSGCVGYLAAGQTATCTITASQYGAGQATLMVYTNINNSYGSYYSPGNFTISVSGNSPSPATFQGTPSGTTVTLGSGPYSVSGSSLIGWTVTKSAGCSGTINAGESRSCTVTYTYSSGYYYNPYGYWGSNLSCVPPSQTVYAGQTATFYAQGGQGTYTWTTPERTYTNVGPVLNAALYSAGTQSVTVTSGSQTAVCSVTVTGSYSTPSYNNYNYPSYYPSYPSYTPPAAPGYVVPGAYVPSLPNTGFEPITAGRWAFALAMLLVVSYFAYPYVRSAFAYILA